MSSYADWVWCTCKVTTTLNALVHACEERHQESRMRENRTSGSTRGDRMPIGVSCPLLYRIHLLTLPCS